jgi:endoglucanase
MKKSVLLALVCFYINTGWATGQRAAAFEMNGRLGRGINIGNTFEAPSETAWGNPWNPEYCRIISELGFSHIRIPVRWETAERSLAEPPYTIQPVFLERIRSVIDTALSHNLHVIINMHHHNQLFQDPEGQKERFLSQWEQIADYFSDYPDSLLFEVLNEPHAELTPEKWNVFFAEALALIRTGNPDRTVLMGTAEWGGLSGIGHIELPEDQNLILTVHYYNPFTFTHQGADWTEGADAWLGTKWNDTETERETIMNEFRTAVRFSEENNIPVHIGEFGAYSKADMDSRVKWTTFVSRYLEQLGFSWAYWEFSAGFGIYDRSVSQLRQELVDALLHNPMPEPVKTNAEVLYKSNFTGGNDGWNLFTGGSASATLSNYGSLEVSITSGGNETWHIQLVRSGVPLITGRMYRLSIQASSAEPRSISYYTGRASSPWNSYSGYASVNTSTVNEKYSLTFTMNDQSDHSPRLVIDLGKSTSDFRLFSFLLEEISIVTSNDEVRNSVSPSDVKYFPNPVNTELYLLNLANFYQLQIFGTGGKKFYEQTIDSPAIIINMQRFPAGIYFVRLTGSKGYTGFSIYKT